MAGPNVIICQCDMLRAFEVGCYGNPVVRTPQIDRLASAGVRFATAVTNNPVCTPARSCLLTGQFSRTCAGTVNNVFCDPPTQERNRLVDTTLPEAFKAAGYHTALIGKWHVWGHPNRLGFDSSLYPCTPHRYYGQTFFENFDTNGFVVEEFGPEFEIARVRQFLKERRNEPFFLHYNPGPPHMPVGPGHAPRWYSEMYRPADIPLRPNVFLDGRIAHSGKWFKTYTIWDYFTRVAELHSDRLPTGMDLRQLIAWYYGMVTVVDDMLGRLMATLCELDLTGNTVVVFVSDHGDNLGSHHLFNKDCLFEESIRIPLIFHLPGAIAPAINTTQVAQLIDLMPTLLELCGIEVPRSVQGQSLLPILRGERATIGDNVGFIETDPSLTRHPCIGIRTPDHLYGMKLSADFRAIEDDAFLFFDLRDDPFQQRNLAAARRSSPAATALRQRLLDWNAAAPWLRPQPG